MLGAAWLGMGSAWQTTSDIQVIGGHTADAGKAREEAAHAYKTAIKEHPPLAAKIRDLQIDLALPPVRFPDAYALAHLSTNLETRLARLQKYVNAATSPK